MSWRIENSDAGPLAYWNHDPKPWRPSMRGTRLFNDREARRLLQCELTARGLEFSLQMLSPPFDYVPLRHSERNQRRFLSLFLQLGLIHYHEFTALSETL